MSNRLYFAAFALGVGIGVYGAADYFKNKYRLRAEAEIESVRKAFKDKENAEKKSSPKTDGKPFMGGTSTLDNPPLDEVVENRRKARELVKKNKYEATPGPYIISEDDYGGTFEYDSESLVYYADGVLINESQELVKDAEDLIGPDALDALELGVEDVVYVRNDEKQIDYDIQLDPRKWSDVQKKWAR